MITSRGERRRISRRKAQQRKRKVYMINKNRWCKQFIPEDIGYFENNNIINKFSHSGCSIKTKTKNSHQTYRHKRTYGKAVLYCAHDNKQVEDMNYQEKELNNGSDSNTSSKFL